MTTKLGDIDLLGEITGGGGYPDLLADSVEIELFGRRVLCLGLDKLIQVKRAVGRPPGFKSRPAPLSVDRRLIGS